MAGFEPKSPRQEKEETLWRGQRAYVGELKARFARRRNFMRLLE
jgi:hypothetical protein